MSDISYNRRVHYYIALYELFQEQECLHCVDIARKLSISLPAASRMLQKLIRSADCIGTEKGCQTLR